MPVAQSSADCESATRGLPSRQGQRKERHRVGRCLADDHPARMPRIDLLNIRKCYVRKWYAVDG